MTLIRRYLYRPLVQLADFGIARRTNEDFFTAHEPFYRRTVGKRNRAPEQFTSEWDKVDIKDPRVKDAATVNWI